jgi:hypothetical protein
LRSASGRRRVVLALARDIRIQARISALRRLAAETAASWETDPAGVRRSLPDADPPLPPRRRRRET